MRMLLTAALASALLTGAVRSDDPPKQAPKVVLKSPDGKTTYDLSKLTAQGPVLVRLTCGCSGCDKELAYFQELHEAYEGKGLTSLAVFKEPDNKVAEYVKQKKLNMLYAVDTKGESWNVFKTKAMPTNFLIEKGGRIVSIAAGCDPRVRVAPLSSTVPKPTGLVSVWLYPLRSSVPSNRSSSCNCD